MPLLDLDDSEAATLKLALVTLQRYAEEMAQAAAATGDRLTAGHYSQAQAEVQALVTKHFAGAPILPTDAASQFSAAKTAFKVMPSLDTGRDFAKAAVRAWTLGGIGEATMAREFAEPFLAFLLQGNAPTKGPTNGH